MKMKRLMWGCIMIVATGLLAGCGSDGTSLLVGGQRATQTAIDNLQKQADDATDTLDALQTALGADSTSTADLTAAVTGLQGMRDDYQGKVDKAMTAIQAALGDAATDDLAADIATLSANKTMYAETLEAVRMALDAMSTDEADLKVAIADLERMRDNYETMVKAVRDELNLDEDATQDMILAAIQRLENSVNPFAVAQQTTTAANAAIKAAADAVKEATENSGKLSVLKVKGDSAMAEANAQKVLAARDRVTKAVTDSTTAQKNATDALAAVKDTDANADSVKKALNAAIEVAKDAVEKTMENKDSDALKDAVKAVTGTAGKMTPADHAETVAKAIAAALAPTSAADGSGIRITDVANNGELPNDTTDPGKTRVEKDDHMGMTWEEIVGSANVMDKRIVSGSSTTAVKASSVDEKTLGITTDNSFATITDGMQVGTIANDSVVTYKGIPGVVFCQGTDCKATEDNTANTVALTGSWYFTPADEDELYQLNTTTDLYAVETAYVNYGYWLTEDTTTGNVTVHTYALSAGAGTTAGTNYDVSTLNATGTTLTDSKATYKGDAVGISYMFSTDTKSAVVDGSRKSAQFTADVELAATFGPAARLGGTVNNFKGDAVDSTWEVKFLESATNFTTGQIDDGTTTSTGQDGIWDATAYGTETSSPTKRPAGIFGTFNAHFTNGNAAGAYTTRKE